MIKLAELFKVKKLLRVFFFFCYFFIKHPDFLPVVEKAYAQSASHTPLYQLCTKRKNIIKIIERKTDKVERGI